MGATPTFTSKTYLDVPDYGKSQDSLWVDLSLKEITSNDLSSSSLSNVTYNENIGYQLKSIHDTLSVVHEQAAADTITLRASNGNAIVDSNFIEIPTYRPSTDQSGVTTTGTQGDYHLQKAVPASGSWASTTAALLADYSSFPPPTQTEIVKVERVLTGLVPMYPDDTVVMRFYCPSYGGGAPTGIITRCYFTGLATTSNGNTDGSGQYCVTFWGDGQCELDEKLISGEWTTRATFQWAKPNEVADHYHMVTINSDAWQNTDGNWYGSTITFKSAIAGGFVGGLLLNATGFTDNTLVYSYPVSQVIAQAITFSPVRIDARQDLSFRFAVSFTKFPDSGTITTSIFATPDMASVGSYDPPIAITVSGIFPSTSSVTVDLFGYDGTLATALTSEQNTQTLYATFDRLSGYSYYYAVITLTPTSSNLGTPTVQRMTAYRPPISSISSPTTVELDYVTGVSIMGAHSDPSVESAHIEFNDYQDQFDNVQTRSGISVEHVLECPTTANPTQFSILFKGKIQKAKRFRRGVPSSLDFPDPYWSTVKADCAGMWTRLAQQKTTKTWNFGQINPNTGKIYLITEILQSLLQDAGLPATMIDIPYNPLPLQLDPSDADNPSRIEVYTPILGYCLEMASRYLGAYLVYDPNATNLSAGGTTSDTNGCWRLRYAQRISSTYTFAPLAHFVMGPNWTGTLKEVWNMASYNGANYPVTSPSSQPTTVIPTKYGTQCAWIEPPEGNAVLVTGTVATNTYVNGPNFSVRDGQKTLTARMYNWPAAYFGDFTPATTLPPNPDHPDYTDGQPNWIVLVDPGLNSYEAVSFACRRIFDLSCHAREYISFEGPLGLVWDFTDSNQIRPRPLRYGDLVQADTGDEGATEYWIVSSCIPDNHGAKGGSKNLTAVYELFRVPALMDEAWSGIYSNPAAQMYAPALGRSA